MVVLGHGLARDWTDMPRGGDGPAGGGLVGRPINPLYLCTIQVTKSLAEGALSAPEGVHFSAQLHGTAPIETVEIISGGQCVWHNKPNSWDVELDGVELPVPEGDSAYYYLRLRQADGHRAWLSPVWLCVSSGKRPS
ncbi:MAG: hypothetical protein ACI906_003271 [Candidatus Latescibacterota bacterium]